MQSIKDADVKQKRVLLRTDFNVPLNEQGKVEDAFRIQACVPTIQYLQKQGCKVLIITHIGRPQGREDSLSLKHIQEPLQQELGCSVSFFNTLQQAHEQFSSLENGSVALLENIRFEKGEQEESNELAQNLAQLGDIFVNDAFAVSHRKHTTIVLLPQLIPAYAGLLLEKEISVLDSIRFSHQQRVVFVMGGSKVKSKIRVLEGLIDTIDVICCGGVLANMLLEESGQSIGSSYIEGEHDIEEYLQTVSFPPHKILLPIDAVVCEDKEAQHDTYIRTMANIQEKDMILDIGPKTIQEYVKHIQSADIVFWNGPMGLFEVEEFQNGTKAVIESLAKTQAKVVVGGGDAISALDHYNARNSVYYVCTGGGAMLEYLAQGSLVGIKALEV